MDLREARRLTKLSQLQLDELAGIPKGTVADLEQGRNKRPAFETVVRIVRAIRRRGLSGIEAEELFPVPDDSTADDAPEAVNA